MWDLLKKSLAFGIGAAAITGDRLREIVDEAVSRGEMSTEDGKKFLDEARTRGEEERQNMQNWIREQVTRILREAGAAEKSHVETLEKRIMELEKRLSVTTQATEEELTT